MESTRPTRTPAIRTSSPIPRPDTSVNTAEYDFVAPFTLRCNVLKTVHVSVNEMTRKMIRPMSGLR
jgi:hypothetical protein